MSTEVNSRVPRKSSFSLAALFYLIAIFGVLFSIAVQAAAVPIGN